MTGRYSGIVFDKDGTLFDFGATWEGWAKSFLLRIGGTRAQAEFLGQVIGFDLTREKFSRDSVAIAGTPSEIVAVLEPHVPDIGSQALLDIVNQEAMRAEQHEAVPLEPFLRDLRQSGYRLGVATNDAEIPARAHLDGAGVTDLFDFICGFDSGFGGKPAPGQLLAFAEAMGLPAQSCVMVGDSRHDLRAGRTAGFATVGVLTGIAEADELADLADVILPNIGGLRTWLGPAA